VRIYLKNVPIIFNEYIWAYIKNNTTLYSKFLPGANGYLPPMSQNIRAHLDTGILKSRLPNYSASVNSQGMAKTEAEVVFGCTWLRLSV